MTQTATYTAINSSKLIRFLHDMAIVDIQPDLQHFADKLGSLIDLADSMTMSDALRSLKNVQCEQTLDQSDEIKRDCLEVRAAIIASIMKSFVPEKVTMSIPLPFEDDNRNESSDSAIESWQRFYSLLQSDMDFQLHKLRLRVRRKAEGQSERMAKLVALDQVFSDTLADHARKMFAVLPRLLVLRYQELKKAHEDSEDENAWLEPFYDDMRGLLLAELDFRLQPILGLVEALDEEVYIA